MKTQYFYNYNTSTILIPLTSSNTLWYELQIVYALFQVKLIVIDSITFPFKEGISVQKRTGLLFRQMADLQRIAMEGLVAVS